MSTAQRPKFLPGVTPYGKLPGITNVEEQKASGAYNLHFVKIDKIHTNEMNERYAQIDIQSLAASIMTNGLFHNLVTTNPDENKEVRLISGERRYRAMLLLRDEYPEEFKRLFPNELIPCKVMDNLSKVDEEISLIEANSQVRILTLEEKLDDISRLKELYEMKKDSGVRISEQVAKSLNMSERQVYKYMAIMKLNPVIYNAWENKTISLNMASEIAGFGETEQLMLAEVLKDEKTLTEEDLQAARELKKKKIEVEEQLEYTDKKIKAFEGIQEKSNDEKERKIVQTRIDEIQKEQKGLKSSLSRSELKKMRMLTRSNKVIDNVIRDLDALDGMSDASKEFPEISARLDLLKIKLEDMAAKL